MTLEVVNGYSGPSHVPSPSDPPKYQEAGASSTSTTAAHASQSGASNMQQAFSTLLLRQSSHIITQPSDSNTCTSPSTLANPSSPSSNLKRSRSTSVSMATDNAFPPAPPIDGEAMLEVFVHRSMKFTGAPLNDSIYGDGQRLAALGSKVVEAAYTDVYFNRKPMLRAEELKQKVEKQLQEDVMTWVEAYKWRDKVRCTPGTDLKSSEETRLLFDSYAGAVFAGAGYKAVRDWISALVDPHAPPQAQPALAPEPDYKRVKVEPVMGAGMGYSPSYYPQNPQPYHYGQPPPPPPPASAPPPLPMQNPLSPAQPHSAFLPLFNQTAQQRRLEVQYPAMFSGPAHAGRWTVSCLVNGIEKGMGMGASKQLAKEEAARQAYYAMGWAPRV